MRSLLKNLFKKKIVFITLIVISIFLLILIVNYSFNYMQKLKETKKKELILQERQADELKLKGDFKQALEEYKVVAKKTEEPGKKLEAEFMQANIYAHQLKDKLKAREIYLKIVKEREQYKQTPQRVIDALLEMGLIYWNEKNYQQASRMYEIALNEYPDKINYADVAWYLGACYQMLGKDKEAAKMIAESQKRR